MSQMSHQNIRHEKTPTSQEKNGFITFKKYLTTKK